MNINEILPKMHDRDEDENLGIWAHRKAGFEAGSCLTLQNVVEWLIEKGVVDVSNGVFILPQDRWHDLRTLAKENKP